MDILSPASKPSKARQSIGPNGKPKREKTPLEKSTDIVYQRIYDRKLKQKVKFINSLPNSVMPTETDINLIASQQRWGICTKKLATKVAQSWKPTTSTAMTIRQQKIVTDQECMMTKTGYKKSVTMMKMIDNHCKNQDWPNLVVIEKAVNRNGLPIGRGLATILDMKADAIFVDYHHTFPRAIPRTEARQRKQTNEGQGFVVFGENGLDTYDATEEFCLHDNHKSKLFFICIHL